MKYADILKVNGEITMIDLKGKNYAMVPERVNAFRKLYPEGFINTEIISHDGTTVTMQAKAGFYREDGSPVILGTGFAQEVRGKGMVNGTSYIENCETSAVGRALGMIGLGINGGGICSAEELVNAITAQNQMKQEKKTGIEPPKPEGKPFTPPAQASGAVTTAAAIPGVGDYIKQELTAISSRTGIDFQVLKESFAEWRKREIKAGTIPNLTFEKMKPSDAENLISLYRVYVGDAA